MNGSGAQRWYTDSSGRICTVASFAHGDFDETPIFRDLALAHNGRISSQDRR